MLSVTFAAKLSVEDVSYIYKESRPVITGFPRPRVVPTTSTNLRPDCFDHSEETNCYHGEMILVPKIRNKTHIIVKSTKL